MGGGGLIVVMAAKRNACEVVVGNPEGKRPLDEEDGC
jgi:hypothetical protein